MLNFSSGKSGPAPCAPAVQTRLRRVGAVLVGVGLVTACGNGADNAQIGSKPWGAFNVAVEVRPAPPRPGHNEVVVIVTGEHHRPVYDAIVSLRADERQDWVQAIEDGHVGVYRRAVYFGRAPAATLQVRLQRADSQAVVEFPVKLASQ